MKAFFVSILVFLSSIAALGQSDLQKMLTAEKVFVESASERGVRSAFLDVLSSDSIIFRPEAVNGRDYWSNRTDPPTAKLVREPKFGDISFTGLLGYTMGNWRSYPKGKSEEFADFGQYVTIWEKRGDKFYASLDIGIRHEELPRSIAKRRWREETALRDPNKRAWSPADASLKFLQSSMKEERLGAAYKEFADDNVRLLIEREPPIMGKKDVIKATNRYVSVEYPKRVALFQSADMAYTWNACQYSNSNEGIESGNCLHIWKLRKKKWWIVVAVFARVSSDSAPTIKVKDKTKAKAPD